MPHNELPYTSEDYILTYPGYWTDGAFCRIRVYRSEHRVVIVATDMPENTNTSITNRAEVVHFLAWERAGKPSQVEFVENYPHGRREETFEWVDFDRMNDGAPAVRPIHASGFRVPQLVGFGSPRWRYANFESVLMMIRKG